MLKESGHCDRCHKPTTTTMMSIFNTDYCCMECLDNEKKHPKYDEARDEELRQVQAGNYNFPGIGLPKDL